MDDFELDEGEWASVFYKADAVCGDLEGIFCQCDKPREDNDAPQRPIVYKFHLLEFQVPVPGKSHKYIGYD